MADLLDDIASADPPAYLQRCFAEGSSASHLSWHRVQQLAACAVVLDAVANRHDYAELEPELIADWRVHYAARFSALKAAAVLALRRALDRDSATADPDSIAELTQLEQRLEPA
jgi:hypothetical protein